VEVTAALAIVAFSMTVVLGLIPLGLETVRETSIRQGIANVSDQLRSELQQMPLTADGGSSYGIDQLPGSTLYYGIGGERTEEPTATTFFVVEFAVSSLGLPTDTAASQAGIMQSAGSALSFQDEARQVLVTISYPYEAPEANREIAKLPFIIAK